MASRSIFSIMRGALACRSPVTSCNSGRVGKLGQHDRRPLEQLGDVGILQRVLVLRLADARADLHVLAGLAEEARCPATLAAALRRRAITCVARRVALAERLEVDHDAGRC